MTPSNKKEILEQLESGRISAEEAAQMLSESSSPPAPTSKPAKQPGVRLEADVKVTGDRPSMFHVRVNNLDTGENRVSVNIPLRILKFGLRLGGRFSQELEGLNFGEINEWVTDMESGMLVEVQNKENNEHVQIYLD